MTERPEGGYYAVIPAEVRYDKGLKPNAKLLYGELTSLCNKSGYCWATNEYFAELYGLSTSTISRLISQLEAKGYIRCEMAATSKGSERRIYAGAFVVSRGGIDEKSKTPLDEKRKGGLDENIKQNNTSMNNKILNTPQSPPEGGALPVEKKKRKRRPKSEPEWRPEKFEGFWAAYPKDDCRAKAVEQWDALPHDKELMDKHLGDEDALLREIALGLKRHLESRDWRENIGIPHAFRWLRDRRWTEKVKQPQAQPAPDPAAPRQKKCHTEIVNGEEVLVYDS